ncbi:LacI family DNA-binding transcriptional regulator [Shimia marina]|nr:LacI family DNA-binding transcriptional regulator [Shimia marina]
MLRSLPTQVNFQYYGEDMKGKRVTAQDVADRAGVSRHAVSRCFREGTYLSEAKRAKIVAVANELGYRPNALAASLKGQNTKLIGIVSGNLSNFYDAQIVSGLVERLSSNGKWPVVLSGGDDDLLQSHVLDVLAYPLEAMILRAGSLDSALSEQCGRLGIPLILSGARPDDRSVGDSVCCENSLGVGLAVKCLHDRGRRRIAYVGGPKHLVSEKERFGGFLGALGAHGLSPVRVVHSDFSFPGGEGAAEELFGAGVRPDGIFCSNDALALGVLSAVRARFGVAVPDDVSIIGFDDIPMAQWPDFQLTTIANPISSTVEGVMELLTERLANPEAPSRHVAIKPEIILRNTH